MATVLIGVLGHDAHTQGIAIIEYALKKAGIRTVNLMNFNQQEDFINAALEVKADAIWVSSSYGMGELDCRGFRQKCTEAGIGDILLYAGGHLGDSDDWSGTERKFREMGFDRVYPPNTLPSVAISDLKQDLQRGDKSALPASK